MKRLIVATVSLSLSLSGAAGIALAQEKGVEGIITNADGADVRSTAGLNPVANGEGGTIIYGDITTGPGHTVIGPPTVVHTSTPPEVTSAPAPEPAPEAVAETTGTTEPVATDTTAVATESDLDADNYPDALEWDLGLDGNNPDTDLDGAADGDELNIYGTDPLIFDTDGDGISDGEELFGIQTDPLIWEDHSAASSTTAAQEATTDVAQFTETAVGGEQVKLAQGTVEILTATDGDASALGTGNASAAPGTVTRGGSTVPSVLGPDGTYSVTEVSPPSVSAPGDKEALVPVSEPAPEAAPVVEPAPEAVAETTGAAEPVAAETATSTDLDADNYPDELEWDLGLDPNNIDTDADGVADGDELNIYGTEPTIFDTDGDGIGDGGELYDVRTDPLTWEDHSAASGEAAS